MRHQIFILLMVLMGAGVSAQVGINTETPSTSAALDVTSTDKGFLPPRMTGGQRDAITNPATGLIVYCTNCGIYGEVQVYNSISWTNMIGGETSIPNVTSPTGKIWMDRNLGATQVATSSTDAASYGDLYQWGRGTDGHQLRTSGTTTTLSSTDEPGHGDFIINNSSPIDWRSPQNDNLWQGVNGANNPCPSGYRLPTETELKAEISSWTNTNAAGALASPLKLPLAGSRLYQGSVSGEGTNGIYWTSTVWDAEPRSISRSFRFDSSLGYWIAPERMDGYSVRCLKD